MQKKTSRREFMKQLTVGSGFALTGLPFPLSNHNSKKSPLNDLLEQPNFLFIITDQERHTQYFPDGWEEANLPNLMRLKNNGLTFTNAFCNSCMCSPSRSTMLTGLYPAQHQVTDTLPEAEGEPNSQQETELDANLQNIAKMLKSAGYNVYYKGKWHMSKPQGSEWTEDDLTIYGFDAWDPPDAGEDTAPENYGGGRADHDQRFVDDAVQLLQSIDTTKPFALFVSLVNPHDVAGYPDNFENDYDESMLEGEIKQPPTLNEDLSHNYKPQAHAELLKKLDIGLGGLIGISKKKNYVNFYGNLLKYVDNQIGQVLDALNATRDGKPSLTESTIVFRFADHGEMGLSHGGLRQKMFVIYEEAIHIPLIVSNPLLFPVSKTSDALVSLIDMMPTIATLAKVPDRERWIFKGVDFSPIINDPTIESVQDEIVFTFDDVKAGTKNVDQLVDPPNRIRCIREKDWVYARYFDKDGVAAPEYEMYDLVNDSKELENLAHPLHPNYKDPSVVNQRDRLAAKLAAIEAEKLAPLTTDARPKNRTNKPIGFELSQNYPNPFNSNTTIRFSIHDSQHVTLKIFDPLGREIKNLIDQQLEAGNYSINFHAEGLVSGHYFYRLQMGENNLTKEMILVK